MTGFTHAQLDLADWTSCGQCLSRLRFDVLINAAALTNVDYCEDHRDEAMRLNAEAPHVLAEICREHGPPVYPCQHRLRFRRKEA